MASAVPESVRPLLPALMEIAPFVIEDVPPVTLSIALSRSPTLSVMPMLVPLEVEPATKEKVVPLTTSVSVVVKASDETRKKLERERPGLDHDEWARRISAASEERARTAATGAAGRELFRALRALLDTDVKDANG